MGGLWRHRRCRGRRFVNDCQPVREKAVIKEKGRIMNLALWDLSGTLVRFVSLFRNLSNRADIILEHLQQVE
jgi:hypothetical protein